MYPSLYCSGRDGHNLQTAKRVWPFFWHFRRCPVSGRLRRSLCTSGGRGLWWWQLSQSPGFPCSQGYHSYCSLSTLQTKSLPAGKGVPMAGLMSSPVSLVGWMVPRGPASPFACLLFHPICSSSSLHVEVIVCNTLLSTAWTSLTTIILPLLPLSFK